MDLLTALSQRSKWVANDLLPVSKACRPRFNSRTFLLGSPRDSGARDDSMQGIARYPFPDHVGGRPKDKSWGAPSFDTAKDTCSYAHSGCSQLLDHPCRCHQNRGACVLPCRSTCVSLRFWGRPISASCVCVCACRANASEGVGVPDCPFAKSGFPLVALPQALWSVQGPQALVLMVRPASAWSHIQE